MKAGCVLHAKTMKLCEGHPGMEYQDAQEHILRHDTKLKEAYAMGLEADLATGQFAQEEPKQTPSSLAGIRVDERVTALAEVRKADGLPELSYLSLVSQVLKDDPELAASYTGAEV